MWNNEGNNQVQFFVVWTFDDKLNKGCSTFSQMLTLQYDFVLVCEYFLAKSITIASTTKASHSNFG